MANLRDSVNDVPSPLTEDNMETAAAKEILEALPHIKEVGAKHLWFDFDEEADVLYVTGILRIVLTSLFTGGFAR